MNHKGRRMPLIPNRRRFIRDGAAVLLGIPATTLALAQSSAPSQAQAGPEGAKAAREGALAIADHTWTRQAIRTMWEERRRSGVTPLIKLQPPFNKNLRLYLKDESKSPTGSLKHRVAWAEIMSALVDGVIGPETHLYESSSGNTAIGEAYFAKVLGLPYTAVMRPGVSDSKHKALKKHGGNIAITPAGVSPLAHVQSLIAASPNAYDINQFANTQKALDFFDADPEQSMSMAGEIFRQLRAEPMNCPEWFVAGAGTGGTATSIARYLRKWADFGGRSCAPRLAVVDPEDSVILDWYLSGNETLRVSGNSRIEGIGLSGPLIFGKTHSLLRTGISQMFKVPDSASIGGMQLLSELVGFDVGPSSGTNFYGALRLLERMHQQGRSGSVVSIICDDGGRYRDNYHNPVWVSSAGFDPAPWRSALEGMWHKGRLEVGLR